MYLEHAHERRSGTVAPAPFVVAARSHGNEVTLVEERLRVIRRECRHGFHPR
jgi:hypothetical protein